jgi:spore maturation protein CgeB
VDELQDVWRSEIRNADVVILGSFTPEGKTIANWLIQESRGILAFYDIDTPITLAALQDNRCEYLAPNQIPEFDLYLSFTGGPSLRRLEQEFGAQQAKVLYCCADEAVYFPEPSPVRWDLGYMGTYSADRQPKVDTLLIGPAARLKGTKFVVAGPQYPTRRQWPTNIKYIQHLSPLEHRSFYNSQRFTLNVTRRDMIVAGFSPSVRLFEAAACATPIISDYWDGLDTIFHLGTELLTAATTEECCRMLRDMPEEERIELGLRGRQRILRQHTAKHRAMELHGHIAQTLNRATRLAALM